MATVTSISLGCNGYEYIYSEISGMCHEGDGDICSSRMCRDGHGNASISRI